MKRLLVNALLLGWLAGCVVMPTAQEAVPPGHRPGGLHPSQAAALRNHLKHGYHNLEKGKCDKAQADFAMALEIDPANPDAQVGYQEAIYCLQGPRGKGKAR